MKGNNCLYPLDLESADPNTIENVKELLCNLNLINLAPLIILRQK
ncbi:hypothetical protein [Clostridium algidicarnis]|nr:hypothetical protein [Clostridium algidicarnis]